MLFYHNGATYRLPPDKHLYVHPFFVLNLSCEIDFGSISREYFRHCGLYTMKVFFLNNAHFSFLTMSFTVSTTFGCFSACPENCISCSYTGVITGQCDQCADGFILSTEDRNQCLGTKVMPYMMLIPTSR